MKLWFSLIKFTCEKAACELLGAFGLPSRRLTGLEVLRQALQSGPQSSPETGAHSMCTHCFAATQSPLVALR